MARKLYIGVIIFFVISILFIYFVWSKNRPIYVDYLPFYKEIINNDDNVIINLVDKKEPTKLISYNDKICSNYNSKLTSNDLEEQNKIIDKINKKLENNEGTSDTIYKYVPRGLNDRYGSHAIPLIVAALVTSGDILELGIGKYSTPALNKIAKEQKKLLLSVESEIDWMNQFAHLNDSYNHLIVASNSECAKQINMNKRWGVVFVDHLQGGHRYLDMIKYAEKAEIVIAHDSEKRSSGYYTYEKAYPSFKYHCKYSLIYPDNSYLSTSLLSNYITFDKIQKILNNVDIHLKHVVCDQTMKKKKKK